MKPDCVDARCATKAGLDTLPPLLRQHMINIFGPEGAPSDLGSIVSMIHRFVHKRVRWFWYVHSVWLRDDPPMEPGHGRRLHRARPSLPNEVDRLDTDIERLLQLRMVHVPESHPQLPASEASEVWCCLIDTSRHRTVEEARVPDPSSLVQGDMAAHTAWTCALAIWWRWRLGLQVAVKSRSQGVEVVSEVQVVQGHIPRHRQHTPLLLFFPKNSHRVPLQYAQWLTADDALSGGHSSARVPHVWLVLTLKQTGNQLRTVIAEGVPATLHFCKKGCDVQTFEDSHEYHAEGTVAHFKQGHLKGAQTLMGTYQDIINKAFSDFE
jgi:hypothetical protein